MHEERPKQDSHFSVTEGGGRSENPKICVTSFLDSPLCDMIYFAALGQYHSLPYLTLVFQIRRGGGVSLGK